MRKSLKKEYELDRCYDFGEYWTPKGRRFTKRRSHRRIRSMKKPNLYRELADIHVTKEPDTLKGE